MHIERGHDGREALTVRIEVELAGELRQRLSDKIGVRVDVELLAPGALPRSERKTQRVFDHRTL